MNQESFEEIYHEHKGLVFRLALTYVRHTEEAEDITQNVFIKVFQKKSQFTGKSQLKTWIFRIATTTCLDHLKSQKANKRSGKLISMHKENGQSFEIKDSNGKPDENIENQELSAVLLQAIRKLDEPQRSIFYLSQVEGAGNIEIAEITNKSVGAIESILQRSKVNLRKGLEEMYDEYRRNS